MSDSPDKIEFSLKSDYIELIKLLKLIGICESGGMAKEIVAEGQVRYNGEIDFRKRLKLRRGDVIRVLNVEVTII